MFGLIGHSTSFEEARIKARSLGYDEYADGDLDMWCAAPPQLVEEVTRYQCHRQDDPRRLHRFGVRS